MESIYDLHCDLLKYLEEDKQHTPVDSKCPCALPYLRAGGVKFQALPVFHTTDAESVAAGEAQVAAYQQLLASNAVVPYSSDGDAGSEISVALAVENAATFCSPEETLQQGLARVERWQVEAGPLLYISLTWNEENRFGGGSSTDKGLTDEGRVLLDWMAHHKVPVDLSHTSDWLAEGILEYIDAANLSIPILASHSNARSIAGVPRNLPDHLIKEIVTRNGVIGLNLVNFTVGESYEQLTDHVAHLFDLGARQNLGFGADFFYEGSMPPSSSGSASRFFDELPDASCYPKVIDLLRDKLSLAPIQIDALAHGNVQRFIEAVVGESSKEWTL